MPVLLLDKEKCLGNIERMARKAEQHQLSLRPHSKTHQSAEIAHWFRDVGVKGITVSSFQMARYFAKAGWEDILVAFPFQPGELEDLQLLSEKNKISILVDSPAALPFLNQLRNRVNFYIDIDTGYGRTGVRTENAELIEQIIVKAGRKSPASIPGILLSRRPLLQSPESERKKGHSSESMQRPGKPETAIQRAWSEGLVWRYPQLQHPGRFQRHR